MNIILWTIFFIMFLILIIFALYKVYKASINTIDESLIYAFEMSFSMLLFIILGVITLLIISLMTNLFVLSDKEYKASVNTEYHKINNVTSPNNNIININNDTLNIKFWKDYPDVNILIEKNYDKTIDLISKETETNRMYYYDYLDIKMKTYKKINLFEYLKSFGKPKYSVFDLDIKVIKSSKNLSLSGKLIKTITDRDISYQINNYILFTKSNELDVYCDKNINLDIVYNTETMKNNNHISDFIILFAKEIKN